MKTKIKNSTNPLENKIFSSSFKTRGFEDFGFNIKNFLNSENQGFSDFSFLIDLEREK